VLHATRTAHTGPSAIVPATAEKSGNTLQTPEAQHGRVKRHRTSTMLKPRTYQQTWQRRAAVIMGRQTRDLQAAHCRRSRLLAAAALCGRSKESGGSKRESNQTTLLAPTSRRLVDDQTELSEH
jgi:hypothetical protein